MKIQWSGLGVVAGSGKIGGSVVGKGRSGAFARVRVKPVNPRTSAQVAQRSKLSTYAQGWRGLTAAQISAWNAAADSGAFTLKNSLGIAFKPTGEQLYVQLNLNLAKIGASAITDVPVKEALPAILLTALEVESGTESFSLTFTGALGAEFSLAVYATAPLSPGISRPSRSQFRQIGVYASDSPADMLSAYQGVFGDPIEGQRIFVYAEVISETTGQSALAGSVDDIVEASA